LDFLKFILKFNNEKSLIYAEKTSIQQKIKNQSKSCTEASSKEKIA